ncbi:MAG: glycosyltransferase family 39 protein [Lentisphaerae bacterium]|nr:glycosyltransferase family 39 protein [Lentisphaerota bacterium]
MAAPSTKLKRIAIVAAWVAIIALALHLRSAGLFRGLSAGVVNHPDAAKQVLALDNFLHDRYVWYTGNVFYDGYPLFLNHVDEWILRGVQAVRGAVQAHLDPGTPVEAINQGELFYWGRALRVLYGMLVLMAAVLIGRRGRMPAQSQLLTALLLAITPLAATVTHAVTGDIGVDLFSALSILCVAGMVARPQSLLRPLLAGVLVGFAFASKYHGLMAGWVPGIYILLSALLVRHRWGLFLKQAGAALGGMVAGIVVAIPQFISHPERTWSDIVLNFRFIKSFNVPPEFYERPWLDRLGSSVSANVPLLLLALGVALCAMATVGLAVVSLQMWRAVRARDEKQQQALFLFAVFSFPLLAAVLSLLGKPSVEPFHFSYAGLPLVLAAVYGLFWLWNHPRRHLRALAVPCALALLLDFGMRSYSENFFWSQEENWVVADHLSTELVRPQQAPSGTVKSVQLEGPEPTLAVFRNCMVTSFGLPDSAFWNAIGQLPIPGIPVPGNDYWIFVNGPIFPRSDRMFHVADDSRVRRCAVYESAPEALWIGLRSGAWPAQVVLRCGRFKRTFQLAANTQRIVPIDRKQYDRRLARVPFWKERLFIPIQVDAAVGNVWATLLSSPHERAQYQCFGGDASDRSFLRSQGSAASAAQPYEQARYLESQDYDGHHLAAGDQVALFNYVPLAAGAYRLSLKAHALSEGTALECRLYDPTSGYGLLPPEVIELSGGEQTVTFRFTKPFAPYQVTLALTCVRGSARLGASDLRPDLAAILADLQQPDGAVPLWARPFPADLPPTPRDRVDAVVFGNRVQLVDLQVPDTIQPGHLHWQAFRCAMRLTRFPFRHFTEYDVFLDLQGPNGVLGSAMQFPLYQATTSEGVLFPLACMTPTALAPGEYRVYMGIRNRRTGKVLPIHNDSRATTVMIGTTVYKKEEQYAND